MILFICLICLFISHPNCSFPSNLAMLLPIQERRGLRWISTKLSITKCNWLDTSSIDKRRGSPVLRYGCKGRQQSQGMFLLLLLGVPHEDQAAEQLHTCRGPRSATYMFLHYWSISVGPYEPRWVESVGFSSGVLHSSGFYNPSSLFSGRLPEFRLIFVCVSGSVSISC